MNVPLVTRSSFSDNEGTLIVNEEEIMEKPIVSGIALDKNQARVTLRGIIDRPGIAAEIFTALADANINVDIIVQNVGHDGKTNLGFTVPKTEMAKTKAVIDDYKHEMELKEFDDNIAKVSIVGVGMKSHSGVAAKAFNTLAQESINIMMISTSEIKISVVIEEKYSELAVRSLHGAYDLDK
jgi:aspartate kinase